MQSEADMRALAATLLDWYREMGVDAAVADEAIDWLARGDAPPGAAFRLASPSAERIADSPPRLAEGEPSTRRGEGLGVGGNPCG